MRVVGEGLPQNLTEKMTLCSNNTKDGEMQKHTLCNLCVSASCVLNTLYSLACNTWYYMIKKHKLQNIMYNESLSFKTHFKCRCECVIHAVVFIHVSGLCSQITTIVIILTFVSYNSSNYEVG